MFRRAFASIACIAVALLPLADAASWTVDYFKNPDGSRFNLIENPTVIKLGPDLRYYVGAKGKVFSLGVSSDYHVRAMCVSQSIGDDRTVLGMAFEPRQFDEDDIILYIGTAQLNWAGGRHGNPADFPGGWKNGMVQTMRGKHNGFCLAVTNDLVTGLSVSNHDHGVNGIVIDKDGDMYVIDGGMTNAGHSELGDGDGGSPATPLSGALLRVEHNKDGFVGDVLYDSDDGRVANIMNEPDVKLYSSGLMNAFGIERHSNGHMYMVDNGPNPEYGKESTSCTTNLETEPHFPDKFLLVREGVWYGHPNRNRGRNDAKQCVFQSIYANAEGQERPLEVIESSTNGIAEYASNKLGSGFKGAMCFARIGFGEPGNSFALFLDEAGEGVTGREEILEEGGLDMIMDRFGNLVITEFMLSEIKVLMAVPEGPVTNASVVVHTVHPRMGPQKGGNKIWITGAFPEGETSVLIGQRLCDDVKRVDASLISCTAPRGEAGSGVEVGVTVDGTASPSLGGIDYTYMELAGNEPLKSHVG